MSAAAFCRLSQPSPVFVVASSHRSTDGVSPRSTSHSRTAANRFRQTSSAQTVCKLIGYSRSLCHSRQCCNVGPLLEPRADRIVHRRLFYDTRLQPKVAKTLLVRAEFKLTTCSLRHTKNVLCFTAGKAYFLENVVGFFL